MTGMATSGPHHYGGSVIEPHTPASATMLHELRQCVLDSMSHCKDTTQLEWLGFSWLTGGRHQSSLDAEGNPYVFLSKIVEGESEDEDEDEAAVRGIKSPLEDETVDGAKLVRSDYPTGLWAESDLNISEVQGVKMWDKEVWAGRL
jgi:hypothetical protein